MTPERSSYRRHRFPAEIISQAVWLYHVFSLSLRDVELILAERGVAVTHESIRHWCKKFGEEFARFRLPTIFHPLATAHSMLIRRDKPLQMTLLPGGPSLALAR
jgi:hypothetical protein